MTTVERLALQRANEQMGEVRLKDPPGMKWKIFPCRHPGCENLIGRTSRGGFCRPHMAVIYQARRREKEKAAKP